MLTKSSSPARGIMNEVARSLLTVQELSTFKYYITEYEQNRVSVEDLAHALLQMLNTKEKVMSRIVHYDLLQYCGVFRFS